VSIPGLQGYLPLAGGTLTGNATIAAGAITQLYLNKTGSGSQAIIRGQMGGLDRWRVYLGDTIVESGSNAGSNFAIQRYDDTGAVLGIPLSINRATGHVTIPNLDATNITQGGSPIAGLPQIAQNTVLGSITAGTSTPTALTQSQLQTLVAALPLTGGTLSGPGNLTAANFTGTYLSISAPNPGIGINKTQDAGCMITGSKNNLARWRLVPGDGAAESTGNAGSNFSITRFDDAGNSIDVPFVINRATGVTTITSMGGTVQAVTASYSLLPTDSGKILNVTAATAITITAPNTLPVGFYCTIRQQGAGVVTFAGSGGMVVQNRQSQLRSAGQFALCSLVVAVANTITLGGDTQT